MYFTHKMLIIVNTLQGPWLYTMTPIFYKTKTVLKNNSSQKTERLKRHINQRQWVDLVLTLIQPNKLHMYLLENLGNFNIAHFRILKNYWKLIDIIITLWIWIFCFCNCFKRVEIRVYSEVNTTSCTTWEIFFSPRRYARKKSRSCTKPITLSIVSL